MRYNRWVRTEALHDIDRIANNHPETADLVRKLAAWIIEQLADDPLAKGETRTSPEGKISYVRWPVGPVTVIYSVLPDDDLTVIVEGFVPNQ